MTSESIRAAAVGVAFQMIYDKAFNAYDLIKHLKKHKTQVFQNPLEILTSAGTNLLHEMADKGRLSLFMVILTLGWWPILSKSRVPQSSPLEHKGCNAAQIAEKKRTRKIIEEIRIFDNWESSLTPLMKSCRFGDVANVKAILNNAGNPQELYWTDLNDWNALHWAVAQGNQEIVKLLMAAGVDMSKKTKKGETLLHVACVFGQSHLIDILMRNDQCKFDPYLEDLYSKSSFDRVAENGDIQTLKELMKAGHRPQPNFLVNAAYSGRQKCVEYCVEEEAMDVDGTDAYGRTPLHRATENKKDGIVKYERFSERYY